MSYKCMLWKVCKEANRSLEVTNTLFAMSRWPDVILVVRQWRALDGLGGYGDNLQNERNKSLLSRILALKDAVAQINLSILSALSHNV